MGLISRVSSRTYRYKFIMIYKFDNDCKFHLIENEVDLNNPPGISVKESKFCMKNFIRFCEICSEKNEKGYLFTHDNIYYINHQIVEYKRYRDNPAQYNTFEHVFIVSDKAQKYFKFQEPDSIRDVVDGVLKWQLNTIKITQTHLAISKPLHLSA